VALMAAEPGGSQASSAAGVARAASLAQVPSSMWVHHCVPCCRRMQAHARHSFHAHRTFCASRNIYKIQSTMPFSHPQVHTPCATVQTPTQPRNWRTALDPRPPTCSPDRRPAGHRASPKLADTSQDSSSACGRGALARLRADASSAPRAASSSLSRSRCATASASSPRACVYAAPTQEVSAEARAGALHGLPARWPGPAAGCLQGCLLTCMSI